MVPWNEKKIFDWHTGFLESAKKDSDKINTVITKIEILQYFLWLIPIFGFFYYTPVILEDFIPISYKGAIFIFVYNEIEKKKKNYKKN